MTDSTRHQRTAESGTVELPIPETDTTGIDDVVSCPYCDRPFRTTRLRDLHVGEVHLDACTDEERSAYETAFEDEEDDLFIFHMKMVLALGLLFFFFVFAYMGVTIHL